METRHKIYKHDDKIEMIMLVSPYEFKPAGTQEDWIEFCKNKAVENNWKNVELYAELQDKETGYCDNCFIKKIM